MNLNDVFKDISFDVELKNDIENTVCFTGHRPREFPNKGDTNSLAVKRILSVLYLKIYTAIQEGYTTFITGMSTGVDMWAANFVLELKEEFSYIKLICVLPCKEQCINFSYEEKAEYREILLQADKVICLSEEYQKDCMRKRNQYMVNHSSKIIAFCKKRRSGTGMTINMAVKKGICLDLFDMNANPEIFGDIPEEDEMPQFKKKFDVKTAKEVLQNMENEGLVKSWSDFENEWD